MPNSDTPPMIANESHMSGSCPVLIASIGPYWPVAGGFFRRLRSFFGSAESVSGSTSAGHQFFGGSLNRIAQRATTMSM